MCWSSCAWGGRSPGVYLVCLRFGECMAGGVEQRLAGSAMDGKGAASGLTKQRNERGHADELDASARRIVHSEAPERNGSIATGQTELPRESSEAERKRLGNQ